MLSVIGGYYRENCLEPIWDEAYGSGVRSAYAISSILSASTGQSKVHLHTWASTAEQKGLRLQAQTFGVGLTVHDRKDAIQFQYDYGLAQPRLYPPLKDIQRLEERHIEAENAVVFGLVEDTTSLDDRLKVTVHAKAALVYDPQAERNARPWCETGHHCSRLAIVANQKEAEAMALRLNLQLTPKIPLPQALAQALLVREQAEVVVVKNGAEGAFVAVAGDVQHIPSYKTTKVFPIGSGDIFTAVFAAYWAELGIDPVLSAQRASVAAAIHSERKLLPIPVDLDSVQKALIPLKPSKSRSKEEQPHVYIAGPLFTFPQRWFIGEVLMRLSEQGVKPFSPYHEVGTGKSSEQIVREDLAGLDASKAVFAILDGLDSGTLYEIGYAVAKGIPVVGFRQTASDRDLTMLLGSPLCRVYDDLPSAIYHAAWTALEK